MIGNQLAVLACFKGEFIGDLSCNAINIQDDNLNMNWISDILHVKDETNDQTDYNSQ